MIHPLLKQGMVVWSGRDGRNDDSSCHIVYGRDSFVGGSCYAPQEAKAVAIALGIGIVRVPWSKITGGIGLIGCSWSQNSRPINPVILQILRETMDNEFFLGDLHSLSELT